MPAQTHITSHVDRSARFTPEVLPEPLALLLVQSLTAPFDPTKYKDSYREKLDALIAAKLQGLAQQQPEAPSSAPIVNILDALKRSLESTGRTPPLGEQPVVKKKRARQK